MQEMDDKGTMTKPGSRASTQLEHMHASVLPPVRALIDQQEAEELAMCTVPVSVQVQRQKPVCRINQGDNYVCQPSGATTLTIMCKTLAPIASPSLPTDSTRLADCHIIFPVCPPEPTFSRG
jgi:hypothetical protein